MKTFEVVYYDYDFAKEKLLELKKKNIKCILTRSMTFNYNYELVSCYVITYQVRKKIIEESYRVQK